MEVSKTKKVKKVFCPICGKPPYEATVCPKCGTQNICSYHLYKFFADREDSPIGCPKCGPRCAVCGAQTELVFYNGRAVCTSCYQTLKSSESVRKEQQRKTAEKLKRVLSTVFTFGGLGVGIFLGLQEEFQKMILNIIKLKLPLVMITGVWGLIGLIVGSLIGSIFISFIRAD